MDARQFITAISAKCPSHSEPLPDCPLVSLRAVGKSDAQKKVLAAMTDPELDALLRKHFLCVCRKDGCGT